MKKVFITSGPRHVHSFAIAFAACTIGILVKAHSGPTIYMGESSQDYS